LKSRNHRRKQIENKVSSLEDYAVEVIQETKDFNNAMGQESLTRFDQPKRKNKQNQSQQWKTDLAKYIKLKQQKPANTTPLQAKRNLQ
jgi:hypothetical protein